MQLKHTTLSLLLATHALLAPIAVHAETPLRSIVVGQTSMAQDARFEGRVEAVRQAVLSAQVPGTIVQLHVRAGDPVRAGQVLMQIDARSAEQTATASEAQAAAARAGLNLAEREFARQQQLFAKAFISQAALDQAEAQFKATQAQLNAQIAQAAAAKTISGQYAVRSPYDGVVSELAVLQGDMAMPGRPLITVYDPSRFRVTAYVPQSTVTRLTKAQAWSAEVPALGSQPMQASQVQLLPVVDPATMTQELRLELPPKTTGLVPGQFARAILRGEAAVAQVGGPGLSVPTSALVRRAELDALYVIDAKGRPLLRQVRLGTRRGDQVQVLAGLASGERVALEPQAAARQSQ